MVMLLREYAYLQEYIIIIIGIEILMPMSLFGLHEKLPKEIFDEEYSPDLVKAFALHELFGSYIYYEHFRRIQNMVE